MRTVSRLPFNLAAKVAEPVLVLLAAGIALAVLGVVLADDTLRTLGYSALGSALVALGVGYAAPPTPARPTPTQDAPR